MLPVLFRQFARRQQIAHDLSQIDVDAGPYLIAKVQTHPEDIIRSEGFHFILFLVRLVGGIDTDKPVGIGPLRVFIKDRIQDILVDFFRIVPLDQINHIVAAHRNGFIVLQVFNSRQMFPHIQERVLRLFNLRSPVPGEHDKENRQGNDDGHIAAHHKFSQA